MKVDEKIMIRRVREYADRAAEDASARETGKYRAESVPQRLDFLVLNSALNVSRIFHDLPAMHH